MRLFYPELAYIFLQQKENTDMEETMGTKELANKVLREIGCSPQDTEEGRMRFDYQESHS